MFGGRWTIELFNYLHRINNIFTENCKLSNDFIYLPTVYSRNLAEYLSYALHVGTYIDTCYTQFNVKDR